jgi:hypothetical protein
MGSSNSQPAVAPVKYNLFEKIPDDIIVFILGILGRYYFWDVLKSRLVCKRFERMVLDYNLHNSSISKYGYWLAKRSSREVPCPYWLRRLYFFELSARIVNDMNEHSEMFHFSPEIYPFKETQASEQYFLLLFKTRPTPDSNSTLVHAALAQSLISRGSARNPPSPVEIVGPPPRFITEDFENLKILGLYQLMLDRNLMGSLGKMDLDSIYLGGCSSPDDSYHFLDDLEKFESLKILYFSCAPNKSSLLRLPPNIKRLYANFNGKASTNQTYVIGAANCKSLTHL